MNDPLKPGKAELQAQNIKSLLENPAFESVFMELVREQRAEAIRTITKATEVEALFKAAGQLKVCDQVDESLKLLVEFGERQKNERLKQLTQENLRNE